VDDVQILLGRKADMGSDADAHGLPTPNEAFFHRNPNFLCFGRHLQIGQINFGAFGYFRPIYQHP
jgi:hypothetical protein